MSNLSKEKLKFLNDASYMKNKEAHKLGKKHSFRLVKHLSTREHKVFLDDNDNPYVAYTGSRKFEDFAITDPALLFGLHDFTSRFQNSKIHSNKVRERFNKPLTITGHSLGGRLAEHVAEPEDTVYTVDKGTGFTDIGKKINDKQTDFRSPSDIISVFSNWQRGGKKIDIDGAGSFNPLVSHDKSHLSKIRSDFRNINDAREPTIEIFREEL